MVSKKKVANQLKVALYGRKPLSLDVYVEVLAGHETKLKESLDDDADDALLCMIADEGDVAMLVSDWDGSIYRNDNGLKKLWEMWGVSFDPNNFVTVVKQTCDLLDKYDYCCYSLLQVRTPCGALH